jgi:hypothetical protein
VSNDPDLLDEECPDCAGTGVFCECDINDDCIGFDCHTCGGSGLVLRGP